MKSIVIFYSRTGNTKYIAEQIAQKTDADLRPLIDIKKRKGVMGFLGAGYDAIRQKVTQIEEFDLNLNDYDLIFLGTPNWAVNIAPALRTFLTQYDLKKKKIVLFCTQGDMGAEKVFNNIRLLCQEAEVISEKYFNKVNKNKEAINQQVEKWLETIKIN